MANFITGSDFVTAGAVSSNSAQANFPATNVLEYTRPTRVYKATDTTTSEFLTFDFGAATVLASILIDNTNVTSLKVQGNATDSWGTPSIDQTVSVGQNEIDRRYKIYHTLTSFNYQFLRIVCNTTSTTDAAPGWQVGAVACLAQVTTWSQSAEFPFSRTRRQAVSADRDPIALGHAYGEITLATSRYAAASMETTLHDLIALGEHTPLVFYRNYGDTADAYTCHRTGLATMRQGGPNHVELAGLTLTAYA